MTQLPSITVPDELYQKVKLEHEKQKIGLSAFFQNLINQYFNGFFIHFSEEYIKRIKIQLEDKRITVNQFMDTFWYRHTVSVPYVFMGTISRINFGIPL